MEEYSKLCLSCERDCKQYHFAKILECPNYKNNGKQMSYEKKEKSSYRELTTKEKKGLYELVTTLCANYYRECLLLGTECPLLLKQYYDGRLCTYFKNAVLPLDTVLENSLQNKKNDTKLCAMCHSSFLSEGRKKYCSVDCSNLAKQKATKERVRKHRKNRGCSVTI